MNYIQGKEQRNPRRALFDGNLLEHIELPGVIEPQDRAGSALADDVLGLWPGDK